MSTQISVTLEQAQKIISALRGDSDQQWIISKFEEVKNHSYRCVSLFCAP